MTLQAIPAYLKEWTNLLADPGGIGGINTPIAYGAGLNNVMSEFLFSIKTKLIAMGGTIVWTCNGTTANGTDLWLTKADAATRGANAASVQSFAVILYCGVHLLIAYQGASDDVARFAFSQGSLYVLAGTITHQPTATDETPMVQGLTVIGNTASANRNFTIVSSDDRTVLRIWIFRQGVLQREIRLEQVASSVQVGLGWTIPVVGGNGTVENGSGASSTGGSIAGSGTPAGATNSGSARISGVNIAVGGGSSRGYLATASPTVFPNASPGLNGGNPFANLVFASPTSPTDGELGERYDAFIAFGTGLVQGDTWDDLTSSPNRRVIMIGTMLQPWPLATGLSTS